MKRLSFSYAGANYKINIKSLFMDEIKKNKENMSYKEKIGVNTIKIKIYQFANICI